MDRDTQLELIALTTRMFSLLFCTHILGFNYLSTLFQVLLIWCYGIPNFTYMATTEFDELYELESRW